MQAYPRRVEVYQAASGEIPFEKWLEKLNDIHGAAAIDARIGVLRRGSLGKKIRKIGDGLIELKIDVGPGYRLYVADDGRNALILLCGSKRTQKKDIKQAKVLWADYCSRE